MRQFGSAAYSAQNEKFKVLAALGVVFVLLVLLAFFLLRPHEQAQQNVVVVEKAQDASAKMVKVLVPLRRIEQGQTLEPAMFRLEDRPQINVPIGRIISNIDEIKGKFARALILPDQPLHLDYVTAVKPTSVIAQTIPDGYRAVTINVDVKSSVEGFVVPGAKVDVLWISTVRNRQGIFPLVQNCKVISVERSTNAEQTNAEGRVPSTITLLVTYDDSQKIALAQTAGTLTLTLRGDIDNKAQSGKATTIDDLIAGAVPAEIQQSRKGPMVTVRGPDGKTQTMILKDGKLVPDEEG